VNDGLLGKSKVTTLEEEGKGKNQEVETNLGKESKQGMPREESRGEGKNTVRKTI